VIKGVWPNRQGVLDEAVWNDLKQRIFSKNLVVVEVFITEGYTEDTLGKYSWVAIVTPCLTSS
jgi:hypothetical protein